MGIIVYYSSRIYTFGTTGIKFCPKSDPFCPCPAGDVMLDNSTSADIRRVEKSKIQGEGTSCLFPEGGRKWVKMRLVLTTIGRHLLIFSGRQTSCPFSENIWIVSSDSSAQSRQKLSDFSTVWSPRSPILNAGGSGSLYWRLPLIKIIPVCPVG